MKALLKMLVEAGLHDYALALIRARRGTTDQELVLYAAYWALPSGSRAAFKTLAEAQSAEVKTGTL